MKDYKVTFNYRAPFEGWHLIGVIIKAKSKKEAIEKFLSGLRRKPNTYTIEAESIVLDKKKYKKIGYHNTPYGSLR